GFAQLHGDGIADQTTHRLAIDGLAPSREFVSAREALQDRPLSQRDGPVLLGMPEAPVSEAVKLSGHRRRRFVPRHPPVHARIGLAGPLLVAVGHEIFVPVTPRTAWTRCLDSLQVGG